MMEKVAKNEEIRDEDDESTFSKILSQNRSAMFKKLKIKSVKSNTDLA
jgi:hypothetical protein